MCFSVLQTCKPLKVVFSPLMVFLLISQCAVFTATSFLPRQFISLVDVVLQKHNQTRTGSVSIHVQALMEGKIPPELLSTHLPYTTYFLTGIISNFYRREWTHKSLDHILLFSCHAISIYHFFQGNFYSYVHYRGFKLYPKISKNYF